MVIVARENLIGAWSFLTGIIIALLVGTLRIFYSGASIDPVILAILAVLGLVMGYFVAEKDANTFLLASVALVVVSYMGISGLAVQAAVLGVELGRAVSSILGALLILFVPATIITALKTVFAIAKS
jgi:hypothetical protein